MRLTPSLSVATSPVEFGGEGGDGLDTRIEVAGKRAWILVPTLGLEQDR